MTETFAKTLNVFRALEKQIEAIAGTMELNCDNVLVRFDGSISVLCIRVGMLGHDLCLGYILLVVLFPDRSRPVCSDAHTRTMDKSED